MTEVKHTPGPWVIDPDSPTDISPADDLRLGIASISHADQAGGRWEFGERSKANAKLIAQAPGLLADLIVAAGTLRHYEALHRAKGTAESTEKAEVNARLAARFEQTIAKATQ